MATWTRNQCNLPRRCHSQITVHYCVDKRTSAHKSIVPSPGGAGNRDETGGSKTIFCVQNATNWLWIILSIEKLRQARESRRSFTKETVDCFIYLGHGFPKSSFCTCPRHVKQWVLHHDWLWKCGCPIRFAKAFSSPPFQTKVDLYAEVLKWLLNRPMYRKTRREIVILRWTRCVNTTARTIVGSLLKMAFTTWPNGWSRIQAVHFQFCTWLAMTVQMCLKLFIQCG